MDLIAELTDTTALATMLWHAEEQMPRECCGLLVRLAGGTELAYVAGNNLYAGTAGEDRFELDPQTWVEAEQLGEVVAIVHSHPSASANPSMADRVVCERTQLPWLVVGWPSGVLKQVEPTGWSAPYKGRTFHHGVLDCYTLMQDWYRRELGLVLPDFDRRDEWWKDKPGAPADDLYMQHFAEAGFVRVYDAPRRHDAFLMQIMSDRANHAAVHLGDGVILHHLAGRLSGEDVYGGYWHRHTLAVVRHHSQVQA